MDRFEREKPVEVHAMECLGKGFDLTNDFRLRFVKGIRGERLVVLDESNKRDIVVPGGVTISDVSEDIRCDKGDRIRFKSDVLEFNQMSELLNQKSSIQGKVPSGYFNSIFDLSGDWFRDASDIKYLAFDGYFISLYCFHLTASPLVLNEKIKKSVPSQWDPALLSRFIKSYGTHIIVGVALGGQDLLCVRQKHSSPIDPADLKRYLEDLGDYLFSDGRSPSLLQQKTRHGNHKVPEVFSRILQSNTLQLASITETSSKDGITVICSKRGGDVFLQSHSKWLQTVPAKPEATLFTLVPITSLLAGVPGSGYLSHAINLYLRYKPPIEDLHSFLEFQVPKQWAPMFCELPLRHYRKKMASPALQFSFMGPRIRVGTTLVSSDKRPVVGLRLFLEGKKSNRLAVHVQHLSSLPNIMTSLSMSAVTMPCQWHGSDDNGLSNQFLEPVKWKRYSNVCTTAVKYDPRWLQENPNSVFIVTGAQLVSKGKWPKTVLHLRLCFTHLPNCTIRKSEWAAAPGAGRKSNFLVNLSTTFTFSQQISGQKKQPPTVLNSGIYPEGPPVPVRSTKMLNYVDTSEVVRGAHDAPGHWLVTAARLGVTGGKIGLHVKFSLLDYL